MQATLAALPAESAPLRLRPVHVDWLHLRGREVRILGPWTGTPDDPAVELLRMRLGGLVPTEGLLYAEVAGLCLIVLAEEIGV